MRWRSPHINSITQAVWNLCMVMVESKCYWKFWMVWNIMHDMISDRMWVRMVKLVMHHLWDNMGEGVVRWSGCIHVQTSIVFCNTFCIWHLACYLCPTYLMPLWIEVNNETCGLCFKTHSVAPFHPSFNVFLNINNKGFRITFS